MCLLPSQIEDAVLLHLAEGPGPPISERALAAVWNAQRPLHGPFWTTRREPVAIIYRGRWTGGPGPDFRGAIIQVGGGPPQTGDVELHLRPGDWYAHGHQRDPAYNGVILHVVHSLSGGARITP